MNSFRSIMSIIISICMVSNIIAGTPHEKYSSHSMLGLHGKIYGPAFLKLNGTISICPESDQNQISQIVRYKSIPKGLFFSFLLPGSGEFYSGSKLKGLLFFGFEVGAWASYKTSLDRGRKWEQEYINIANEYWDEDWWQTWWNSLVPNDQEKFLGVELPDEKNSEYYEAIGIYEKFNAGWKDVQWDAGSTYTQPSGKSLNFNETRRNSNNSLKWATAATSLIIANHLLSAMDAAWSVFRYNKNVKPTVRVKYVYANPEPQLLTGIQIGL